MAAITRMDAALNQWFAKQARDIHTGLRATVVDVDYSIPSATVQPLASTNFPDGTVDAYGSVFDVPLSMPSGNGGKARLTIPVKPGDIVGLSFSERNENDNNDQTTHNMFPGWAIIGVHSDGNAMTIDPDNVELWNDKVHFSMTPAGDFTLETPVGKLVVDQSGNFKFDNGAANLTAESGGTIKMNGAQVTPDGNIITARGVNMNDFYDYFIRHIHHYTWTDDGGQNNTDVPNA